jgi:glycosyltransferase involved in cell wall biosynthesis
MVASLPADKFPSTYVGSESTKQDIHVSVVIRTLNAANYLKQVFHALMAQRCSFNWEIIVVDNGSEDETLKLCWEYRARVIHLPRHQFISGRAANLGATNTRGELLFFCSSHCVPVGSYFLESAVAPFCDPEMAAVRCIPAGFTEQMANWYEARDIQYKSWEEQQAAEAGMEWVNQYPTEACCIIRRSVWEQLPLDETIEASEDKLWASAVLKKGYKIRSCAEAVFVYTRRRSMRAGWDFNRRCLLGIYRARGYVPLTWPQFFRRATRAALLAPLAAIRYFVANVMSDAYLVTIPWQARRPPRSASIAEYNQAKPMRWLSYPRWRRWWRS